MSRGLSGATDRRMQVMQLAGTGAGYGGGRAGTVPRQKKAVFRSGIQLFILVQ